MAPSAPAAPRRPSLLARRLARRRARRAGLAALAALAAAPALCGCSHAWDDYDPRVTDGTFGPPSGSGGSGGAPGTSSSSTTTTTTTGSGGSGGMAGSGGSGGGVVSSCPDGHIVFADAFDDGEIGPEWQTFLEGTGTIAEAGGAVVATLPDTMADATAGMKTAAYVDVTGCAAFVRIGELADPETYAITQFVLRGPDNVGYLEILASHGNITLKKHPEYVETTFDSFPYDATKHAYWRFRQSAGTTYWETSSDAQTWETHVSDPDPIPLDAVQIQIGLHTYMDEPVAPGASSFEGINVP